MTDNLYLDVVYDNEEIAQLDSSESRRKLTISSETYSVNWLFLVDGKIYQSFVLPFDPLLDEEQIKEIKVLFKEVNFDDLVKNHRPKIINEFTSDSLNFMKFLLNKGLDTTSALYVVLALNTNEYDWEKSLKDFLGTYTGLKVSNQSPNSSLEIFLNLRDLFNQEVAESALKAFNTRFESLLNLYLNIDVNKTYANKEYFSDIKPEYFELFMTLTDVFNVNTRRKSEVISKMFSTESDLDLINISRIISNDIQDQDSLAFEVSNFLNANFYKIYNYRSRSQDKSSVSTISLITAIITDYYDEKWIRSALDIVREHVVKLNLNFDDFLVILDYYQDLEDDSIAFEWILEISGKDYDEKTISPF